VVSLLALEEIEALGLLGAISIRRMRIPPMSGPLSSMSGDAKPRRMPLFAGDPRPWRRAGLTYGQGIAILASRSENVARP
jgi:hypothetical protein